MSKVINPSDSALEIVYRGVTYIVQAGSSVANVPEEAAHYWKTMIHNFIVIAEDDTISTTAPVEEMVEAPEPEIAPEVQAAEEEAAVEEPAVAPKKSKK